MNTLQTHVPSRELCEKLRYRGFSQDTLFYWQYSELYREYVLVSKKETLIDHDSIAKPTGYPVFAAPLASELLERLPIGIDIHRSEIGYTCHAVNEQHLTILATACDALALMYLYLAEKGLL